VVVSNFTTQNPVHGGTGLFGGVSVSGGDSSLTAYPKYSVTGGKLHLYDNAGKEKVWMRPPGQKELEDARRKALSAYDTLKHVAKGLKEYSEKIGEYPAVGRMEQGTADGWKAMVGAGSPLVTEGLIRADVPLNDPWGEPFRGFVEHFGDAHATIAKILGGTNVAEKSSTMWGVYCDCGGYYMKTISIETSSGRMMGRSRGYDFVVWNVKKQLGLDDDEVEKQLGGKVRFNDGRS
jgi:hypothetical protein